MTAPTPPAEPATGTPDWILLWLQETHSSNPTATYFHSRYVEDANGWDAVASNVANYFTEAHADAVRRFQRLAGVTLHPAGASAPLPPPYDQYPFGLPDITVQGCFGEVLAGLLAETVGAAGSNDWQVPAHLFHTHITLFQQLEQQAQSGVPVTTIVGRTGDDCLAFRRAPGGPIESVLYCEAKCTQNHDSTLINDAHDKVSSCGIVDIHQLIEALESRNSPTDDDWAAALRGLHRSIHGGTPAALDRRDAVYYVHGQAPIRSTTWMSPSKPHVKYTAARPLHSVEICLADVGSRVRSIYQAGVWQ